MSWRRRRRAGLPRWTLIAGACLEREGLESPQRLHLSSQTRRQREPFEFQSKFKFKSQTFLMRVRFSGGGAKGEWVRTDFATQIKNLSVIRMSCEVK